MSTDLRDFLYQALGSQFGIVLQVSDFEKVRQRCYAARKEAMDPELDRLQFLRSPFLPEGELWIVKGELPKPKINK